MAELIRGGVYVLPGSPWYVSNAMNARLIDRTLDVVDATTKVAVDCLTT